jgi:hypothetical protein
VGEPFERRRLRVYVAGPISSNVFEGVARGNAAGRELFLEGLAPFVPHFDAFWFLPEGNWRAYLEYDLEFVSICDAVYRLQGESKGADLECRIAEEHGIPVFHQDELVWSNKAGRALSGLEQLLTYAEERGLRGVRQAHDRPQEVAP